MTVESAWSSYATSAALTSLLFFALNLFFVLASPVKRWMQLTQASIILALGVVSSVVSDPDDTGGVFIAAVGLMLLLKYRGLSRIGTVMGLGAATLVVVNAGRWMFYDPAVGTLGAVSAAAIGFFAIIYFAFYEELLQQIRTNRALRSLETQRAQTVGQLERHLNHATEQYARAVERAKLFAESASAFRERIEELEQRHEPEDLVQYDLTRRQEEVLKALVTRHESNVELGERLGISERTVKSHIYSICNKVGVDRRVDLIELFRWNWSHVDHSYPPSDLENSSR